MSSMFQEIVAFFFSTAGWILESSTLPTDYWKVSSDDGSVITTASYWSNLWKTCVTDSTGVSNCKEFISMLALDGQLFLLYTYHLSWILLVCWIHLNHRSQLLFIYCQCVYIYVRMLTNTIEYDSILRLFKCSFNLIFCVFIDPFSFSLMCLNLCSFYL